MNWDEIKIIDISWWLGIEIFCDINMACKGNDCGGFAKRMILLGVE